ncbi:MAG: dethiobiotin synthase [Planctomycetaceae bacterium]
MQLPGLFVVGTDTDVGKTVVATAIVRGLRASGRRVGVYKPVASGLSSLADERGDPWRLWDAAGRPLTVEQVCPQAFAAAIAPPAAARAEGRVVDDRLLRRGLDVWTGISDVVVVEGAGGLFSPVGESTLVVDLAKEFAWPLVLVDAARLGAIGRSLATICAARAEGLRVAAVVLSHTAAPTDAEGPASAGAIARDSAAWITSRTGLPVAVLDHGATVLPEDVDWLSLATG